MSKSCCNICEKQSSLLPLTITNRPGLNALRYRIGEYGDFWQNLLEKLSLHENLKDFTARDKNDYSIALTDAWSIVADVFTFYQERIINESYLRTATERFSVLELARLVGYELRPGVAASTYIAFTLEEPQATLDAKLPTVNATNLYGGALPVTIDKGVKIQSIPEKDQLPQIFETTTAINARIEWNQIKPQLSLPQEPINNTVVYINGINNNIKKGDSVLIKKGKENLLRTVREVSVKEDLSITQLTLEAVIIQPLASPNKFVAAPLTGLLSQLFFTNTVSEQIMQSSFYEKDLMMVKNVKKWTDLEMKAGLNHTVVNPVASDDGVFVFRKKASVFGYNAQKETKLNSKGIPSLSEYKQDEKEGVIFLDNAYDEILSGGFIVIQNPGNKTDTISFYKIEEANTGVLTRYGISSKTTTLVIKPTDDTSKSAWWGTVKDMNSIRQASVLAQSEKLSLADRPDESAVTGDSIILDKYYPGFKEKQPIAITGEKQDLPGILFSEIGILKETRVEGGKTVLVLMEALQYQYIRKSVVINANVALATNGETVHEILGSGNAAKAFQKFVLKQPPLTYVSAASSSGVRSSLEIRVNDLLWQEVDFFIDKEPGDRIYITRQDNEKNTTVIFGDGINGARLPGGNNNVVATYRKGIGSPGILKAKQLSQLATKPLQVKSAINPVITTGAEDAETIDKAKRNASLTILTLDRIVSLRDYEDFATAFAGIAKAHATWARRQNRQQVFLTIAAEDGAAVLPNSVTYQNLIKAIERAGANHIPLNVTSYTPRYFNVSAGLIIDPAYLPGKVIEQATGRLIQQFSFDARNFMQPVTFSEVVACIQDTPGVVAVDIDNLYRSEESSSEIKYFLESSLPAIKSNTFSGAELLTIAPNGISLKIIV